MQIEVWFWSVAEGASEPHWVLDEGSVADLDEWKRDNDDEEVLDALEMLEAGADEVLIGGGAAALVCLRVAGTGAPAEMSR